MRIQRILRVARVWRRWSAPAFLVAFQAAPVSVQQGADGQLSVSVGYGAETFLQKEFGCNGMIDSERRFFSQTVSAVAERIGRSVSWEAFGGITQGEVGGCRNGGCESPLKPPFDGGFGGVIVSREAKPHALGFGAVVIPKQRRARVGEEEVQGYRLLPAFHIRVGDREDHYFRMDFMHVTSAGQPPMGTAGMTFTDDALRDRTFVGVAVVPRPSAPALGLTGNIAIPVGSSGAVVLGGFFTQRGQALNVGAMIRR